MKPRYPFTARMVADAPAVPGVFALWENGEMIYIGRAMRDLREVLFEHLHGGNGCTKYSTHYAWRLSLNPARAEQELLNEYLERHGGVPRCNAGHA